MDERAQFRLGWSRIAGLLASSMTAIWLVIVLGLGALLITAELDALACFDGDEPGCDQSYADSGLGAVRLTSWLLALAGVVAVVAAFITSWRLRRPAHLLYVLALCTVAITATAVLSTP